MNTPRILIVDDDPVVQKVLQSNLQTAGYEVEGAMNANEAIRAAQQRKPDLMILDLSLVNDSSFNGIIDGFSLLSWMRYTVGGNFPVIVYTVDDAACVEFRAAEVQAYGVVRKSEKLSKLLVMVHQALYESGKITTAA